MSDKWHDAHLPSKNVTRESTGLAHHEGLTAKTDVLLRLWQCKTMRAERYLRPRIVLDPQYVGRSGGKDALLGQSGIALSKHCGEIDLSLVPRQTDHRTLNDRKKCRHD